MTTSKGGLGKRPQRLIPTEETPLAGPTTTSESLAAAKAELEKMTSQPPATDKVGQIRKGIIIPQSLDDRMQKYIFDVRKNLGKKIKEVEIFREALDGYLVRKGY